jgi:hypothetical protein
MKRVLGTDDYDEELQEAISNPQPHVSFETSGMVVAPVNEDPTERDFSSLFAFLFSRCTLMSFLDDTPGLLVYRLPVESANHQSQGCIVTAQAQEEKLQLLRRRRDVEQMASGSPRQMPPRLGEHISTTLIRHFAELQEYVNYVANLDGGLEPQSLPVSCLRMKLVENAAAVIGFDAMHMHGDSMALERDPTGGSPRKLLWTFQTDAFRGQFHGWFDKYRRLLCPAPFRFNLQIDPMVMTQEYFESTLHFPMFIEDCERIIPFWDPAEDAGGKKQLMKHLVRGLLVQEQQVLFLAHGGSRPDRSKYIASLHWQALPVREFERDGCLEDEEMLESILGGTFLFRVPLDMDSNTLPLKIKPGLLSGSPLYFSYSIHNEFSISWCPTLDLPARQNGPFRRMRLLPVIVRICRAEDGGRAMKDVDRLRREAFLAGSVLFSWMKSIVQNRNAVFVSTESAANANPQPAMELASVEDCSFAFAATTLLHFHHRHTHVFFFVALDTFLSLLSQRRRPAAHDEFLAATLRILGQFGDRMRAVDYGVGLSWLLRNVASWFDNETLFVRRTLNSYSIRTMPTDGYQRAPPDLLVMMIANFFGARFNFLPSDGAFPVLLFASFVMEATNVTIRQERALCLMFLCFVFGYIQPRETSARGSHGSRHRNLMEYLNDVIAVSNRSAFQAVARPAVPALVHALSERFVFYEGRLSWHFISLLQLLEVDWPPEFDKHLASKWSARVKDVLLVAGVHIEYDNTNSHSHWEQHAHDLYANMPHVLRDRVVANNLPPTFMHYLPPENLMSGVPYTSTFDLPGIRMQTTMTARVRSVSQEGSRSSQR